MAVQHEPAMVVDTLADAGRRPDQRHVAPAQLVAREAREPVALEGVLAAFQPGQQRHEQLHPVDRAAGSDLQ